MGAMTAIAALLLAVVVQAPTTGTFPVGATSAGPTMGMVIVGGIAMSVPAALALRSIRRLPRGAPRHIVEGDAAADRSGLKRPAPIPAELLESDSEVDSESGADSEYEGDSDESNENSDGHAPDGGGGAANSSRTQQAGKGGKAWTSLQFPEGMSGCAQLASPAHSRHAMPHHCRATPRHTTQCFNFPPIPHPSGVRARRHANYDLKNLEAAQECCALLIALLVLCVCRVECVSRSVRVCLLRVSVACARVACGAWVCRARLCIRPTVTVSLPAQEWNCPCSDRGNCIDPDRVGVLRLYDHRKTFQTTTLKGSKRDVTNKFLMEHYNSTSRSLSRSFVVGPNNDCCAESWALASGLSFGTFARARADLGKPASTQQVRPTAVTDHPRRAPVTAAALSTTAPLSVQGGPGGDVRLPGGPEC